MYLLVVGEQAPSYRLLVRGSTTHGENASSFYANIMEQWQRFEVHACRVTLDISGSLIKFLSDPANIQGNLDWYGNELTFMKHVVFLNW